MGLHIWQIGIQFKAIHFPKAGFRNFRPHGQNPRSKENFNTIRVLDIPTSSDEFDRYIESEIALNKLNTNLSKVDYKKKLIDSIVCLQSLRKNEKECTYFEYDSGNSKIATICINTLKEKYEKSKP